MVKYPDCKKLSAGETNQIKRLLIAHGWITSIAKDYYQTTKEKDYVCCADNKSCTWGSLTYHFLSYHNKLYSAFRLKVNNRDFTIQKSLMFTKQPTIDLVVHCECGGHYLNRPFDKKQHQSTFKHKLWVIQISGKVQIYDFTQ